MEENQTSGRAPYPLVHIHHQSTCQFAVGVTRKVALIAMDFRWKRTKLVENAATISASPVAVMETVTTHAVAAMIRLKALPSAVDGILTELAMTDTLVVDAVRDS